MTDTQNAPMPEGTYPTATGPVDEQAERDPLASMADLVARRERELKREGERHHAAAARIRLLDAVVHSVWLHADWRFLTKKMTTEQKEAAASAVERYSWSLGNAEFVADRWWADQRPVTGQEVTQPAGPADSSVILGRALLDRDGYPWPLPDRAPAEKLAGPVREVLLVPVEAGWVLEAVARWREAVTTRYFVRPGEVDLADAYDAMVGDRPAEPAVTGLTAEEMATHRRRLIETLRPAPAPVAADLTEPVPVPDSGPGWSHATVGIIAEHLRETLQERMAAEVRALLADRDRQEEQRIKLVAAGHNLIDQRDAARAERDQLRHEAAAFEAMLATARAELAEVTADRDRLADEVERTDRYYEEATARAERMAERVTQLQADPPAVLDDHELCETQIRELAEGLNSDLDFVRGQRDQAVRDVHAVNEALRGANEEAERLRGELEEHKRLFELQWTRMGEATALWRAEAPGERDLVMPDLGALLEWLMGRAETARRDGAADALAWVLAQIGGGENHHISSVMGAIKQWEHEVRSGQRRIEPATDLPTEGNQP